MSMESILKQARVTLPLPLFKTAEFLGWGRGGLYQGNALIPAGITPYVEWTVPDDEVWWRVNVSFSVRDATHTSILPSALRYSYYNDGKRSKYESDVIIQPGILEAVICPPGWTRSLESQGWAFENVTGNPIYNALPAQAVWLQCICFIFVLWRDYEEVFRKLAEDYFRALRERKFAVE